MLRSIPLLLALFSASMVLASTSAVTDAAASAGTCSQRTVVAEQPAAPAVAIKPAANQKPEQAQAPIAPTSTRRSGARWQSLLPGMFR